jgi:hypothetical protein
MGSVQVEGLCEKKTLLALVECPGDFPLTAATRSDYTVVVLKLALLMLYEQARVPRFYVRRKVG